MTDGVIAATPDTITAAARLPRLVVVTHYFPAHGGGLEKVAEKLVMGLADRGYPVCWLSSDTDDAPVAAGVRTLRVGTANAIERWTQLPYPLWSVRAFAWLWREIGKADVVHAHEHLYFPSIAAITIARMRRRPVVITQHIGALRLGNPLSTRLYEAGARVLGLLLFPLVARSVFISRNVPGFFRRDGHRDTRLIFNGVDTQRFVSAAPRDRDSIRERLGLPANGRIVLFVGRFVRKKGVHRVAGLARLFPEVLWVFVGAGPEDPGKGVGNVISAGRVEHDRLPLFYQVADLLILPSSGEGLPLVVQEALCCGAGVLSTDEVASACPEAAALIRSRPVPRVHDDTDNWAATLREVLDDAEYLAESAREERSRVARQLWSWERCITSYDELLRDVAGTPADRTR